MKRLCKFLLLCCFGFGVGFVGIPVVQYLQQTYQYETYESDVKVNSASGVIVNSTWDEATGAYKSYILTCQHCLNEVPLIPNIVGVRSLYNEQALYYFKYIGTVEKLGKTTDFAILSIITPNKLPALSYSLDCNLGDTCRIIGSPVGRNIWISQGIISYKDGENIGTDCSLNPGNSGGMLVNDRGQLLGIAHSIQYYTFQEKPMRTDGVGMIIPISNIFKELTLEEFVRYFR